MALPKIDVPVYKHKLVGLNKTIKFRVFNVKEQKILLHAKEEESNEAMIDAIKQIVELCTFGKVDVEKLPFFDLEDLMLQIRIRSVSDVSTVTFKDKEKNETVDVDVDLKKIKVQIPKDHDSVIYFTDTVGVKMKYPSLDMIKENEEQDLLVSCIDYIFDDEEIYKASDIETEEMEQWVDELGITETVKIKKFFDTMPRLRHEQEVELKDGTKHTLKFEGIDSFFV